MNGDLATSIPFPDSRLVILAREIAMDIHGLEEVLKRYQLTMEDWEIIKQRPIFDQLLQDALITWNNAINGSERIKVKALAAIEDWLPTAYGDLHSEKPNLRDKVELAKLIARLGGVGEKSINESTGSERISITINMGDDKKVEVETIQPRILEHEDHL